MYTIKRELGRVDGLKIGMMGDLKYGRTVHSLAQCATLFENELYFISPQELRMPENIRDHLRAQHARWYETERLSEVLPELDVLYVTRIQRERFEAETVSPDLSRGYRIDARTLQTAKPSLRILHPLPRVAEIAREVDDDPRAAYFRQVRYGLLTRMALLALLFGRADTLGKQEHAELPPNEIWRDS
jgi:aspartate carbamoyltransferase catalytic subunit